MYSSQLASYDTALATFAHKVLRIILLVSFTSSKKDQNEFISILKTNQGS